MSRAPNLLRRPDLWLAAVLAAPGLALAAPPLFEDETVLALKLEAPFRTILRDRDEPEYQPARIVAADDKGAEVAIDLRVRVRGKSRVQACAFPPILLNFPGEQPAGSPFAVENRLKLVTYCNASPAYEQYVRLERQAYLVLNLLTGTSLRTRLVNVTYYDTERGREIATKVGFLIEDEDRFGERVGLTPVTAEAIELASYDPAALALVEVFQYFIGNTDWSALAPPAGEEKCCHNIVPYARADGVLLPVPYDFDSAGIVDAPYPLPDERLPIQDVRQRLFRGRCRDLAALEPVFALFVAQRTAISAVVLAGRGPYREKRRARERLHRRLLRRARRPRRNREEIPQRLQPLTVVTAPPSGRAASAVLRATLPSTSLPCGCG